MFNVTNITDWIKKNVTAKDLLFIAFIIILFFLTRLINLDKFPIFNDEGIYIRWAKIAWHDANWRFISLTDGKQPLQTWATIPFLKLFSTNLLLGGRMFAVFSGLFTLSGIMAFSWYLFGKQTGMFAAILYILTPYFLFYDRLALVDSAVNGFFIWILFLSVILAQNRRLDTALIYGIAGGMATLAKSSVTLFIGLSALAPVLFLEKNIRKFFSKAVNFYILYAVGVVIAAVIYNIQRLSPFLHFVAEKNNTFAMSLGEFLNKPFDRFFVNFRDIPLYVAWESGVVLVLLGIAGMVVLYRARPRLFWYFAAWIMIPFVILSFFMKVLFPRYIIFFPSLMLLAAAFFLGQLKNKTLLAAASGIFILSVLYFNYTIVFSPKDIPLPPVDRGQYIEAWPAGWGIREIMDYVRSRSASKHSVILAEGNFGMTGDVLDTYLLPGDNISIQGYWPLNEKDLRDSQKLIGANNVYVVYAHKEEFEGILPLKLIRKYDKPGNKSAIYLFELTR